MFRNARNKRCKSANMMRCRANKLHVVELTLEDVQPVNTSLPAKFEAYIRQQENCHRPGTGFAEVFIDDVKTLPHYPSDNALSVEGEIYESHQHSSDILNNQRKGNRRYQVTQESDNNNRSVRPYRPISSHQYLTSTELKDAAVHDKNVHLGRPTRTTLLRERQRRRSVPAVDHQQHKAGSQKQDPRTPTRYEAVTNILYSMIPPGQSLHSFLSGARYNRSNWIETMGSLDLASDLPAMGGLPLNTQRQRPTSVQLDPDYIPKAPPDSPVDFMNATVKEEGTGVFLPSLSGSGGTAEPTSPPTKQISENRSRKVAWEEEILKLSPLPDRAASQQEKVRFQTDEPVTGGVHHERAHHVVRPSSVRAPASQQAKHGRDMAAVVVHGISLHGNCARDASFPQAPAEQPPSEGMRRSWSATSYLASGSRPPPVEFNRLDPLKVTGIKVSGATEAAGRSGLRLSALKPWRHETDVESTEALLGSRREGISDREELVDETVERTVVASVRSTPNNEVDHEIESNGDADHEIDCDKEADREIESNREADDEIDSSVDVDHDHDQEIESNREADHEIDYDKEVDREVESNQKAGHEIDSYKEVDHEILHNKDIDPIRKNGHEIDSEVSDASILGVNQDKPRPSNVDLQHLSTDHQIEPDKLIQSDQIDHADESSERIRVNRRDKLGKQGQVNLPIESMAQGNASLPEVGQVSMDDVLDELDQFSTNENSVEQGHVKSDEAPELGQVSIPNESAEEADFAEDSDNLGQLSEANDWKNSGDEKKVEDVVFFITEKKLNNLEKVDGRFHDERINKDEDEEDEEDNKEEEEEEEQLHSDGTAKQIVSDTKSFPGERNIDYFDVMVSERSVGESDGESIEADVHGGQSAAETDQFLNGQH